MKIDGSEIDYVVLKKDKTHQNIINKKEDFTEQKVVVSMLVFLCFWLMTFKSQSLYSFFMTFHTWSFFDFGLLFPPENTLSLIASLIIAVLFYKTMSFIGKLLFDN